MINFSLQKQLHTAAGEMQLQVSAQIERGKFVSLYGASGTGKTSILRMLAGFMKPDDGFINVNDTVWYHASGKRNIEPQQRRIGFVFQDYALFPNMNVRENILFALGKNESPAIVDELLDVTGLTNLAARKIQTLSGGQQQRVALARAIANKPAILLLDEPLSAIDNEMRVYLQDTLKEIHQRYALTTILVSHNANEIIKLSDLVIHLDQGRFQQQTTPARFFQNGQEAAKIAGNIVSIDENGNAVVLIENRLVSVPVAGQQLSINDKVEITCSNIKADLSKQGK
ncbi:molybdenum ABC transporter ATP-binding protein [Niastella yeongjuensis]|uniref:Molybdenum ABC transporter ATP-binding protein n=1 Tax=Niastella yeongjuensis TaxID=354355 RepID=A0A1V9E404_9BACT|nr:ABC transporter ATP-binding protein [Niastella yeongjuensis]OQP40832.1 molybdenum ABC transporter ATP-binding protein [Niastella yeongjuensis]SEP00232.1 molybdate transport system ATP-binding protein [Niastella yeongjuensis]